MSFQEQLRSKYPIDTIVLWMGWPRKVGSYQFDDVVVNDDDGREVGRFTWLDNHPRILTQDKAGAILERYREIVERTFSRC